MLNEIQEFKQYTFSHANNGGEVLPRLNHRNICNGLSGIDRAMTIIARYFYYNFYVDKSVTVPVQQERLEAVREVLKAWCGFDGRTPDGYSHLQGWLPQYIRKVLMADKLKNCRLYSEGDVGDHVRSQIEACLCLIEKVDDDSERLTTARKLVELTCGSESATSLQRLSNALIDLKKKKTEFSKRMFLDYISDDEASKWKNDFKKITYDSIIANAINMGPLINSVLISQIDPFTVIRKAKGTIKDNDKDRILKMVCCFILNRTNATQEYAVINKSDIANWCMGDPKMQKADYEKYLFSHNGLSEQLFETISVGSNVVKLRVHPALLDLCEFKVCAEDTLSLEDCEVAYIDAGSGKPFTVRTH